MKIRCKLLRCNPPKKSEGVCVDSIIAVIIKRPVMMLSTSLDADTLPHRLIFKPEFKRWLTLSKV